MSSISLKTEIAAWLKDLPYWSQYAGDQILNNISVDKTLMDATYQFFLEDEGLTPATAIRPTIKLAVGNASALQLTPVKLAEVSNIAGVNALEPNQQMPFSGQLTIVYGNNGSGKSGYVRMLNNAFNGRGDKEILNNIFAQGVRLQPTCMFSFDEGGTTRSVAYPAEKMDTAFSRFSVFDAQCGRIHLEHENSLHFTPGGFDFFNQYTALLEQLKNKLNEDIKRNTVSNTYSQMFSKGGEIEILVSGLNAQTDLKKLNTLAVYGDTERKRYQLLAAEKNQLQALNIIKQIQEKEEALKQLSAFKENCKRYLSALTAPALEEVNKHLTDNAALQELAQKDGIESLSTFQIQSVGSPEWRQFIVAAQKYASLLNTGREEIALYPSKEDTCLFCHQTLSGKEADLIRSYWKMFKTETEDKLKATQTWLREKQTILEKFPVLIFDGSTALFKVLRGLNEAMADQWQQNVTALNNAIKQLKDNLSARAVTHTIAPLAFTTEILQKMEEVLNGQVEELKTKDPAVEIAKLDADMNTLNDKNILSSVIGPITTYREELKWLTKANKAISSLRTNGVTGKQGELFDKHVTGQYTKLFGDECKKLKVPGSIQITQRNIKGQTLRRLQILSTGVNKVLSEGEQRAACLADFLTEVQLNPSCCGVIFDDPVTSLDHERREHIAQRLVEEASKRQVIIFTHDIAFLHRLMAHAEKNNNPTYKVTTLRRFGGKIGIIEPDLPWVAQPTKKRIGYLKDKLVALQKIEKNGVQDEYNNAAKSWYGFLREGWERAVEERLFKGVVERFNPSVQTQRLKTLSIEPQHLLDIETGMTDSSRWVHDAAAGLNPTMPDTAQAAQDLSKIERFAADCPAT